LIEIRMYQQGDHQKIKDSTEPFVETFNVEPDLSCGVCLTATRDGKPVACGGILMTSDDEGEVWLKLGGIPDTTLFRILKKGYEIVEESFDLHRLTARVKEGWDVGERFVQRFGFTGTNETTQLMNHTYRIYEKWLS
jgi:hypothetical protein